MWRYKHAVPVRRVAVLRQRQPGVAVAEGKVFVVTANAHVLALDATSGAPVWDQVPTAMCGQAERPTVAPLVVKDMVIVGAPAGSSGCAATSTPSSSTPVSGSGAATWCPSPGSRAPRPGPPTAMRGRGAAGTVGHRRRIDPATNMLYFDTGNPAPDFDGAVREGDNLYTDSVVVVDVDSGQIRGTISARRTTCGTTTASWSTSCSSRRSQVLGHFDKNGYFFVLIAPTARSCGSSPSSTGSLGRDHARRQGGRPPASPTRKAIRSTSTRIRRRQGMDACGLHPQTRGCSTYRCRTSAPPPRGGAGSSRRASRTGARAFG